MQSNQPKSQRIPFKEGLFTMPPPDGEGAHLIGSKCKKCGDVFFPKREVCLNCGKIDMEEIALSTRGKLDTYTIITQVPPGAMVTAPFVSARILLPEGVYVGALLADDDFQRLKVGMDVELVIDKLVEDKEGNEIIAYKFRPV